MQIFSLFGIPVAVSGWFLFLLFFFTRGLPTLREKIIWAVVITVSVLVHEFGHATLSKRYGLGPRIWLTGWGGATVHQHAKKDSHEALILIAGPGFGYLLGGLCWGLLMGLPDLSLEQMNFLAQMVWVNIFWSTLNLIPVFPLDGGQLLRVALLQKLKPRKAERITHSVGLGIALLGVGYGVSGEDFYVAILCGFMAFQNYKLLSSGRASGVIRPKNHYAKELLLEAEQTLADGRWHEAARLSYQIRDQAALSDEVLARTWAVLAVAEFHKGSLALAVKCAARAAQTPALMRVWADALVQLGRYGEAREVLDEPVAKGIEPAELSRLQDAIRGRG